MSQVYNNILIVSLKSEIRQVKICYNINEPHGPGGDLLEELSQIAFHLILKRGLYGNRLSRSIRTYEVHAFHMLTLLIIFVIAL